MFVLQTISNRARNVGHQLNPVFCDNHVVFNTTSTEVEPATTSSSYHEHHTIPYHIHQITSCHVMPCHVMSCNAMPCHAMSCHVISILITQGASNGSSHKSHQLTLLSHNFHIKYTHAPQLLFAQELLLRFILHISYHPRSIAHSTHLEGWIE